MKEGVRPSGYPETVPSARRVYFGARRSESDQRQLEERFFKSLRMPNGTHKETKASRLLDLDELILEHAKVNGEISILDVGVASGITTHDLATKLRERGIRHGIVAVDQYLHAKLVAVGPWIDVLFTSNNELVQVRAGRWVRCLPQGPVKWKRGIASVSLGIVGLLAQVWPGSEEDVTLVSKSLENHSTIEFVEQDIRSFRPEWEGRFDVIRAANILNRSYFSSQQLTSMVESLTRYLNEGGVLAVCRTDEQSGESNASLFRRTEGEECFAEIGRLGTGSEIADMVLGHGNS